MESNSFTLDLKRIGFHYFPDTDHYTGNDLEQWLPSMENLKTSSLLLKSEASRAIPESFITALVSRGIDPIIHIPMQLPDVPSAAEMSAIFQAYASWGVKTVILFDRPNDRESWSASGWSQANLVECFLDSFIPLANECLNVGLEVAFPPLVPGGTYWDLSFLRNSLMSLQRRNQKNLLSHLTLCAYLFTFGHPFDWGKGGSERWSGNKPYFTPADSQDQIGFRNFEWVQEIASSVCGRRFPILLLAAGQISPDSSSPLSEADQKQLVSEINTLLTSTPDGENPLGVHVVSALFTGGTNSSTCGWLKPDGSLTTIAATMHNTTQKSPITPITSHPLEDVKSHSSPDSFPIKHYLLLPVYEWGVSDWHLDVIKPFVRKYQPTIGFSIAEAALAARVTVIGGEASFSEDSLIELRSHGCQVERISGDGTSIATQLSER